MRCIALDDRQLERIRSASLSILERTGIELPHPEVASRFADAGARVDRATRRVRIPPDLVTRLVAGAGRAFTLSGRDGTRTAEFGRGKRVYNSSAGQAHWIDALGGERHPASLADVRTATVLADALEGITMPGAMADPRELPTSWRCVAVLAEMVRHTTKPVTFWFHDRSSARWIVEMLTAIRGGEQAAAVQPLCYPLLEPISPLRFPFDGVDLLFETSRLAMPVAIGPMAQTGVSAPGTLAGTMALENAEVLAGICVTQLVRAGTPVCYGGICHAFDMSSSQLVFAGPEQTLFGVAMTQLGKSYGLPVYVNAGLTDAKVADAQAGLESGITLALAAAAGADVFGHLGICGVDQGASPDLLVMQDEIVRYVEAAVREVDVSDEALGLDLVDELGPGAGFLETDHTVEHFRRELWFPRLLDRSFYEPWRMAGGVDMARRCRARREELLTAHRPVPCPEPLRRAMEEIVVEARRELGDGTGSR